MSYDYDNAIARQEKLTVGQSIGPLTSAFKEKLLLTNGLVSICIYVKVIIYV